MTDKKIDIKARFPDRGDFLDRGQSKNIVRGIATNKDGIEQALYDFGEMLGLNEENTQEYYTKKANKRMGEFLKTREASLPGAWGVRLAGEIAPWLVAPTGAGSVAKGALVGAGIGSTVFDPDTNASRVDNALLGGAIGGLFGRLTRAKGVEEQIAKMEAPLALPAPARRLSGPAGPGTAMTTPNRGGGLAPFNRPGGLTAGAQSGDDVLEGVFRVIDPEGIPGRVAGRQGRMQATQGAGMTARGINLLEGPKPPTRGPLSKAVSKEQEDAWDAIAEAKIFQKEAEMKASWARLDKMNAGAKKALAAGSSKAVKAAAKQARAVVRKEKEEIAREMLLTKVLKSELAKGRGKKKADPENPAMAAALQRAVGRDPKNPNLGKGEVNVTPSRPPQRGDTGIAALDDPTVANNMQREAVENRVLNEIDQQELPNLRNQEIPQNMRSRMGRAQAGEIDPRLMLMGGGAAAGGLVGGAAGDGDPLAIAGGALAGAFGGFALGKGQGRSRFYNEAAEQEAKTKAGIRNAEKKAQKVEGDAKKDIKDGTPRKEGFVDRLKAAGQVADEFLGAIDTRIRNISPNLANALQKAEFRTHQIAGDFLSRANPLLRSIDKMNLSNEDMVIAKSMILSDRRKAAAWLRGKGQNEAADSLDELGGILDDVRTYMQKAGYKLSWREGYFPRQVVDASQFKNVKEVKSHLEYLARQKGAKLSEFEEEQALNKLFLSAVNGKAEHPTFGAAAKSLQQRKYATIGPKKVNAYADPTQSFNNYIEEVVRQVERQNFLKGQGVEQAVGAGAENLETAAKILSKSIKGRGDEKITAEQADELAQLIRTRFGPGEVAPQRWIQNFKNYTYAGLLGNPVAAVTQLGDVALSAYKNGIVNTSVALVKTIAQGRRPMSNGLDKETLLGLRDATQDFASNVKSRDLLDKALAYSGFRYMDRLGKNTYINAALANNQKLGKEAFMSKWNPIFGKETAKLWEDVKGFQQINAQNKDNIGLMLWNELSQAQPISLSTLPERYLKHPDGRMAYMLQSFSLRMLNLMRNDIVKEVAAKNYGTAAKRTVELTSLFTLLNGTTDMTKDFMRGRNDAELSSYFTSQWLRMLGLSRYLVDTAGRDGVGSVVGKTILPPTALIDAVDPSKAAGLMPLVGPWLREYNK